VYSEKKQWAIVPVSKAYNYRIEEVPKTDEM